MMCRLNLHPCGIDFPKYGGQVTDTISEPNKSISRYGSYCKSVRQELYVKYMTQYAKIREEETVVKKAHAWKWPITA